jgi:hypothetical protein
LVAALATALTMTALVMMTALVVRPAQGPVVLAVCAL